MKSKGHGQDEIEVEGKLPARIEPGIREVKLDYYETSLMFQGKAPKVILIFTITSFGKDHGIQVPRYYNVVRLLGKPGRGGRFKVSPKGDFLREYMTLFPEKPGRLDRLPMSRFKEVLFEAEIVTVKFARKRVIPDALRYSKIARINRVL